MDDPGALAEAAIAACQRAWPEVRIAPARVVERLRAAPPTDHAHLGELCLVWACLDGDRAALRAIDRAIRAEAERAVHELRAAPWLIDEVHQEVCRRLLVGDAPRLATYAGQAVLGRWLGVAALRTALNLVQRDRGGDPLDSELAAALPAVGDSPELAVLRERYRGEVETALREAFEALETPRDRNLIRLYYVEKLSLERLGQLFRVHAATVSRWLASLREQLFVDIRDRLLLRLGIAPQELDSMLRGVRSALDLTLTRILRT
jgi:RNA polymerase sigma-70 factor, ECF subfamily